MFAAHRCFNMRNPFARAIVLSVVPSSLAAICSGLEELDGGE